jgi:hypothetical protein
MILGPFVFEKWYVAVVFRQWEYNVGFWRPNRPVGATVTQSGRGFHVGPLWFRRWR